MAEITLVLKVTAVFALALAATAMARQTRASVRSLVLACAFVLAMWLPIASVVLPPREVQIPFAYDVELLRAGVAPDESSRGTPAWPAAPALNTSPTSPLPSTGAVIRGAWALGAFGSAIPLLLGLWRSRGVRRRGRIWSRGCELAATLRPTTGLRRPVSVVLHDGLIAPMTCGWFRPTIVMPPDAEEWPDADVRQALLHELEHVRRHDWPMHVVARTTCALYWFHPAVWMAWGRLRLESERACDDAVVSRVDGTAYAQQLVSLARRFAKEMPEPLLSMVDRSSLATRVASVLNRNLTRGRVGARAAVAIPCAAAVVAAVLSPIQTVAQGRDSLTVPLSLEGPGFEAVSVRPNHPDDRLRVNDWQPLTGRLMLRNLTPAVMVTFAYATTPTLFLPDDRVVGVPEWAESERFTIEATAGRSVTTAEMQRMLRKVLVERFGLRVRVEPRQQSAYRLVMARADGSLGPGLRPADETTCRESRRPRPTGEAWGPHPLMCLTMDLFAMSLTERLGRPVINGTGLDGLYDGTLSYAPSAEELSTIYQLAPSELPPTAFTGPALTTALQEQLGLRLEPTRAAIDVLIVDQIDRPTPNDTPGPVN